MRDANTSICLNSIQTFNFIIFFYHFFCCCFCLLWQTCEMQLWFCSKLISITILEYKQQKSNTNFRWSTKCAWLILLNAAFLSIFVSTQLIILIIIIFVYIVFEHLKCLFLYSYWNFCCCFLFVVGHKLPFFFQKELSKKKRWRKNHFFICMRVCSK